MVFSALRGIVVGIVAAISAPAVAAEPAIPSFWDPQERIAGVDVTTVERLRFLTTVDFPPFNFLDQSGRLSGFHVDLARAICVELDILERCQIQALPWKDLGPALERGDGEAVIAGLAATTESRRRFDFSRPYLKFPARFITRKDRPLTEPIHERLDGRRVGVLAGSAHERMLRDYFGHVRVVTYSRSVWLYDDLKESRIDAAFGDGMRLAFWLADAEAESCCRFAGGPYIAPEYLGNGLSVATSPQRPDIRDAINVALREIAVRGVFAELYLRYFPVSFF
jgi:polar amino acid transport system substrate-binding protein